MTSSATLPAANLLGAAKSPYLRQHADNPVHWRQWGEEALAEARDLNKPILLSIGYAACHWCHVMAHESFEDPQTAALMNRLFVNIKVDREERPDIDHIFMGALQALGEQGGWPLTMFLDEHANPFWGGTYFPRAPSYGRPSFTQILNTIADAHQKRDPAISGNANSLARALEELNAAAPGNAITAELITSVAQAFMRMEDNLRGGLRGAPKFPNAPIFRMLWQYGMRHHDDAALAMVHRLLASLCAGGIHDHLGGGFARYSTDAEWLAPHFEKMLYDNAQILDLLALAQLHTAQPRYRLAAEGIAAWLQRDMAEAGAFAAAEDADSEGEEGRFYVWQEAEIDAALGKLSPLFKQHYDVTTQGNWEHKTILRRVTPDGTPEQEEALAAARETLRRLRAARIRPARDSKILADWNGLMIAALARASVIFGEPGWLAMAETAYHACRSLLQGQDGRIAHAWCDGQITAAGLLDDQVFFARAGVTLAEVTGNPAYLANALGLAAISLRHFADPATGSFYTTADDATDVPLLRPRVAADNATPNANGQLAELFVRLFYATGDQAWHDHALRLICAFAGAGNRLSGMSSLLCAADSLANLTSIVIAGGGSAAQALRQAALRHPDPARLVISASTAHPIGTLHPAYGKSPPAGHAAAAFICRNQSCSLPVTDPELLAGL